MAISIPGVGVSITSLSVSKVTGLGTGVATALAVNVGSAGAFVVQNSALGTPSSGTVTNLTGTASININGTVGATTPTTGSFTSITATGTVTLNRTGGSIGTFTQLSATGYGITIIPGADTGYDAFTINNAANTLNKIRMWGDGSALFAGTLTFSGYGTGGGVVSVGAADSGGAGFKVLRVPN